MDFSAFASYVLVSGIGCMLVFALSLVTSYYKKPYLSFIYIMLSVIVAAMLFMTSFQCGDFKKTADEAYQKVCAGESPVPALIRAQLVRCVDTFMCTSDCRCYSGPGDSTKNLWKGYDQSTIMDKFLRNTGDTNMPSSTNLMTYPFKWNEDLETSFTDFRTCHVKKLVPKGKYESEVDE